MDTPMTEAGRALAVDVSNKHDGSLSYWDSRISRVEREARAQGIAMGSEGRLLGEVDWYDGPFDGIAVDAEGRRFNVKLPLTVEDWIDADQEDDPLVRAAFEEKLIRGDGEWVDDSNGLLPPKWVPAE